MRKLYSLILPITLAFSGNAVAQIAFTEHPDLLPYATHSGNCMAVADMNGDGLDDIAALDNSNFLKVLYQNLDGTFAGYDVGQVSGQDQWGMAVADINNDGSKDMVSGGSGDGLHYVRILAPGVSEQGTADYVDMFMQNITVGDIDNDGYLDVFGCHDNAAPVTWFFNPGDQALHPQNYIDFTTQPASDMSGNYGSVMTDFDNDGDLDIYIAHCRQGVNDPADPRRWNRLFVNDGTNNYTDRTDEFGLTDHHQSWAVDFGDWDNDGDLDVIVINHDSPMQFFENDGTGHYSEIGDGGLAISGFLLQCHFEDFDNDGFLDILISGGSQYMLRGNGDGTFTPIAALPFSSVPLHSFALGDLNNDGFMDVWGSYGSGYTTPSHTIGDKLWLNDGNDNHWLNVRLEGVQSNRDGVGARVALITALGTQVREVRSGESYGLTNTGMCHFGLGPNTTVESVKVTWPSGQVDNYENLQADQVLTVVEGSCIAPVAAISAPEGLTLCPGGDSVTLTASGGSSYHWSNGATDAEITVTHTGYYEVTVDPGTSCSATASAFVVTTPDIVPVIITDGDTAICWNEQVTLISSPADSYLWSNGDTTQSITIGAPGNYTVEVDGICPNVVSDPVTISLLPYPPAPISADVSIPVGTTATLSAQGNSILWYDAAAEGNVVGTGSPWTTPVLNASTAYWCVEAAVSTVDTLYGGMMDPGVDPHDEGDASFFPIFECYAPFHLKSVLVHATEAGPRLVGLVSWPDGATITAATYDLPVGDSRIQLDLDITPGTYGLRMFGSNIAMTYNNVNGTYPYPLGDVGAIVSTTNGGSGATAYYEIFYDWEITVTTYSCEGPRTQVNVTTTGTVGITEAEGLNTLSVYPNPTDGLLNVDLTGAVGPVDIDVLDIAGRTVQQRHTNAGGILHMDVAPLAAGEYQLRIRGEKGIVMRRFVVQ